MSYFIAVSLSLVLILGGFVAGYLLGLEKEKEVRINLKIENERNDIYRPPGIIESRPIRAMSRHERKAYLKQLPKENRKWLPIDIKA